MKLRLNIICSLLVHTAVITAALTLTGRDWNSLFPADHITVILESGLSEMKSLHAMNQKKQAIHNNVLSNQDKAASSPYEYGAAVMDKAYPEIGHDDSLIISSVTENNTEKRNATESMNVTVGTPGPLPTAGGRPSSSGVVGYRRLQSGDFVHGQAKTQPKGKNSEDVMAIRKAIEKALVYPLFAKKRGLEGTALVEFKINQGGMPEDFKIVRSSGHSMLDTAAKETVIKASPFPAEGSIVEIPIKFFLKDD